MKFWMVEFFCDLFAVYTLGPAYGWAHLHLSAKRGGDPFDVPMLSASSHPADDARMRVMLVALSFRASRPRRTRSTAVAATSRPGPGEARAGVPSLLP